MCHFSDFGFKQNLYFKYKMYKIVKDRPKRDLDVKCIKVRARLDRTLPERVWVCACNTVKNVMCILNVTRAWPKPLHRWFKFGNFEDAPGLLLPSGSTLAITCEILRKTDDTVRATRITIPVPQEFLVCAVFSLNNIINN